MHGCAGAVQLLCADQQTSTPRMSRWQFCLDRFIGLRAPNPTDPELSIETHPNEEQPPPRRSVYKGAVASTTIPIGQLLLDTHNPRHEPVSTQRETILSLIATERQKLVVLANDIVEYGISPIDLLLVIKKDAKNYTVVEGNRRLAAIRLLANPDLADGTVIETQMKRVAALGDGPSEIECAVVTSRKDAEHWMGLRHGGEAGGAAVVRWNTLAANRFSHKPGTQAAKAITLLEAIDESYPENEVMKDLIIKVAAKRLTTLGRLAGDPSFRAHAAMTEANGSLTFGFPADALQEFFEHILGDLAADVGVSQLKSKEQRREYLGGTPTPEKSAALTTPLPLNASPASKATTRRTRRRTSKPDKPLKMLEAGNLEAKTRAILSEFRKLDADKSPNTVAILTRVILEFTVDQFIKDKGLNPAKDLKGRVRQCLGKIDPTNKARKYQAVRAGLSDGNSVFAVKTLHGFVHNPHFQADGNTVRVIATNLEPFLQALNDGLA